jgi:hypothetical protein
MLLQFIDPGTCFRRYSNTGRRRSAEDALSEDVLRDVAWAQEGLLTEALTMLKVWSRHALVDRRAKAASAAEA